VANLNGLATIVSELRSERTHLVNQLRHVDAALSVLGKVDGGRSFAKPQRTLSAAAGRKRISIAQKARWAKPKRTMSASARRKIAAAQRSRWAKVKAQQKKAA
jgi:nucleoid-associated protein YgaU